MVIDWHVFRFAACQFGQKTAGSPLSSIVRSVARFFSLLTNPVHVAAWVDDLIFIMSTPEHALRPVQPASGEARVDGCCTRRACRCGGVYSAARFPRPREGNPLRLRNSVRETCTGPVEVPALEAEKEMEFD